MEEPVKKNIWAEKLYTLRHQSTDRRHIVLAILAGDFERNRGDFDAALKYYNDAVYYAHKVHYEHNDCTALAEEIVKMAVDYNNQPGINFLKEKLGKVLNIGEAGMGERVNAAGAIREVHHQYHDLENRQRSYYQGTPQHHQARMDIRATEARLRDVHQDIQRDLAHFRETMSAVEFCEAHVACVHFQTGIYKQGYEPGFFGQKAFFHNPIAELNGNNMSAFCTSVAHTYNQSDSRWQSLDSRFLGAMLKNDWVPADEKKEAIEKYMSNPKNHGRKLYKALDAEIQHLRGLPVARPAAP